jgi:small subunit ribosomal protein S3
LDAGFFKLEISRKLDYIFLNIYLLKPFLFLGVNENKLFNLRSELIKQLSVFFGLRDVTINLVEVINPDSNAVLLGDFIRQQLEKRFPFRRVMKNAVLKAQKTKLRGIKIQLSGRLNGAEIARTEWLREGSMPLHTVSADIDYCNCKAL